MTAIKRDLATAYAKLSRVGFSKAFVRRLLPTWWDDSVLKSSAGMVEFAALISQRSGLLTKFDEEGSLDVRLNSAVVRLKQQRSTDPRKVHITSALASALAKLALSRLPEGTRSFGDQATADGIRRQMLEAGEQYISLETVLAWCWGCGIPVLRLANAPRSSHKAFGYSISYRGRYAIVVGLDDPRPARIAFVVAHELGHILLQHVDGGTVIADGVVESVYESLEESDLDEEERAADDFALGLLSGQNTKDLEVKTLSSASELALAALSLSEQVAVDPGHLLLSHAYKTKNWKQAALAHRFLDIEMDSNAQMEKWYRDYLEPMLSDEEAWYFSTIQQYARE